MFLCACEPVCAFSLGERDLELRFANKHAMSHCQEMAKQSIVRMAFPIKFKTITKSLLSAVLLVLLLHSTINQINCGPI